MEIAPPRNIVRFEICLYISLVIDALSSAFGEPAEGVTDADKLAAAGFIVVFLWLVWLVARRRKNWARMILFVTFGLSAALVATLMRQTGLTQPLMIELASLMFSAAGLYFSATGDARGWFESNRGMR